MIRHFRMLILVVLTLVIAVGGLALDTEQAAAFQGTCAQTHTVAAGQNLFRIGLMYGVRWDTLAAWNGIPNGNLIYVGQVLCVSGPWTGGTPVVTPPPSTGPVVVYPGNPFGPTIYPRIYFPEITLTATFDLAGYNFPANRQVTISLSTLGSGTYTAYYTATTDATGQFLVEVAIPDSLKNASTVAVYVTAPGGYWAKNWFYNY